MDIQIVKAHSKIENIALAEFDKQIFSKADAFTAETWRDLESFWIFVDEVRVGSIGMKPKADSRGSCLEIWSTGILPEFQGKGIGTFVKKWQLMHAKLNGFYRIVTRARASNTRSIHLNEKFGFQIADIICNFYENPVEDAIVLELVL